MGHRGYVSHETRELMILYANRDRLSILIKYGLTLDKAEDLLVEKTDAYRVCLSRGTPGTTPDEDALEVLISDTMKAQGNE